MSPSTPSAPSQPSPAKKRRWLKPTLIGVGVLVMVLVLVLLLLPTLLSTGAGRAFVVSKINGSLDGRVEIGGLSLAWGSGQTVKDLKVYDKNGKLVLTADSIEMPTASLWSLARGGRDIGLVKITKLNADIVQAENGDLNVSGVAASSPKSSTPKTSTSSSLPANLKVKLELVDGHITYTAPGVDRTEVTGLNFTADATDLKNIHIALGSAVRQGAQGGQIQTKFEVKNAVDSAGVVQAGKSVIDGDASISALPIASLDALLKQNGALVALLGPTLDAELHAAGDLNSLIATIHAKSTHMTAEGKATVNAGKLSVASPIQLKVTVVPEAWPKLAKGESSGKLDQSFDVVLTLDRLNATVKDVGGSKSVEWATAAVTGSLTVGSIGIEAPEVGHVTMHDTNIKFSSENLSQLIDAVAHSVAEKQGAKPGTVDFTAHVKNAFSADGKFDLSTVNATVNGSIADLPLAVVDQVAQDAGLLGVALGPILNATIDANIEQKNNAFSGYLKLSANAANLDAQVYGPILSDRIQLDKGSVVNLTIVPALVAHYLEKNGQASAKLTEAAKLRVDFANVVVPLRDNKPDYGKTMLDASATVSLLALESSSLGPVKVHDAKFRLAGTPLGNGLDITFKSGIEQSGQTSGIDSDLGLKGIVKSDGTGFQSDINVIRVSLSAVIDRIIPPNLPQNVNVALLDLHVNIPEASLNQPIKPTLSAKFTDGKSTGDIKGAFVITDAMLDSRKVQGNLDASKVPVRLIDGLGNQQGKLLALLGESIDSVSVSIVPGAAGAMKFNADMKSPRLTLKTGGTYVAEKSLTVDSGGGLELDFSPAAWIAYEGAENLALTDNMHVKVAINQLQVGLMQAPPPAGAAKGTAPTTTLDLGASKADIALTVSSGAFKQTADQRLITIKDLSLALQSANFAQLLNIKGSSHLATSGGTPAAASAPATFTTNTDVRGLAMKNGSVNTDAAAIHTDTQIQSIPVPLLDAMMKQNGQLTDVLGNTTSLDLKADYFPDKPGNIDLSLKGDNAVADVHGTLDKNKVLTLRQDAVATMRVTPHLSQAFLAKLNPILAEAQSGKDPIKLTIHKDGFSVPISPFDAAKLNGDIQLDIGTLIMKRSSSGILGSVITGLQKVFTEFPDRDEFPAIFTTLKIEVRNGTLKTNDLWLTTDRHDLALGTKALITKRKDIWYANVTTGIGGETFASIRGLGNAFDVNSVFEMDAEGPVDGIKVDPLKLAAKLAPQLAGSIKGGKELTDAVKQGTDLLSGLLGDKKKTTDKPTATSSGGWPNKPKPVVTQPADKSADKTTETPPPTEEKKSILPAGLEKLIPGLGDDDNNNSDSQPKKKKKDKKKSS